MEEVGGNKKPWTREVWGRQLLQQLDKFLFHTPNLANDNLLTISRPLIRWKYAFFSIFKIFTKMEA